ncbi:hypothetical protein L227DRAFT_616097 [Lentinus tigrinus ALCF2SS1-6]|uniref:Uncharacterized protein n=1 Tax=Lentinus tigrinus ALCF2SS1-6 TaxID=1328759 RepID=A0A5C2RVS4_9APHY|nr:hypothetical protein L227DRAFT_616097 [Lentinus tigrinus ALCF2SS1-6]
MRLQSQNEIIQIAQADVWEYLGITSATRGSLYIRSEYKSMYERLCNSHKWLDPLDIDPPYIPGVIVTGQPGIGKSYFSVYALLQRMADEQPVVFFTRRGWAVYVDDSGIRRTSISSIDAPVDFPLVSYAPPASRIWALIDAPVAKGPIPDAIIASSMFYVLCASPERSTYTHLLKQSAREFYMDPWTDQELFAMFTLTARPSDHRPSLEWVRDMRSEFGPCPRDLVLAARDRERVKRDITRAITSSSMKLLFNLPEDATTPLDVASDELILVRRDRGLDPAVLESDIPVVTFKSAWIFEGVRAKYLKGLEVQDAERLYRHCRFGLIQTTVLAPIVFEGLALKLLCTTPTSGQDRFRGYARMFPTTTQYKKSPHRFEFRNRFHGSTLAVDEDRAVQLIADATLQSNASSLYAGRCPGIPARMNLHTYSDTHTMELTAGKCFIPAAPSNALFDAYFVAVTPQSATLWIVHVAVSRAHTGTIIPEFGTVKEVVAKAKKSYGTVKVKYLLIAPFREALSVQWNMAAELAEVPVLVDSEVFVQFIAAFPQFSVEEVLGRASC